MKNLGMMATKEEVREMLSEVDEDGMFLENTELEVKSNLWCKRELPER